jgi:hypothetical protein
MKIKNLGLMSISISLLILSLGGLYFYNYRNTNSIHIYTAEEQKKINSESTSDPVEFIYTEQEQKDMARWKNKTMDNLVADAFNGDAAALWMIGMCYLTGSMGLPLNIESADRFFAKSLSLGFAPALNQVSQMYFNDESNSFLGLVYKNLTISFGHPEFIKAYHDLRSKMIESSGKSGQRIWNEIERIASHKQTIILNNQQYVHNKQYTQEACWLSLEDITHEDYQYDNDYWRDIHNDNIDNNFSKDDELDKAYLDKLHDIYYKIITSDSDNLDSKIQEIIKKMKQDSYSTKKIESIKKQAENQAKKNYKYVCRIENEGKEAKRMLKILEQYKATAMSYNKENDTNE